MSIVIRKESEGISSFDTEDTILAATLLTKGYKMICSHPNKSGRRTIYHFVITSNIEKTAQEFYKAKENK
ncbi:MAG TPA: hypothetical protein VIH90_01795 [Candidatus Saccharimonadales bacterium]